MIGIRHLVANMARHIPSAMGELAPHVRQLVTDLFHTAEQVQQRPGLAEVPAWLQPLFDHVGASHGVPPLLLAAIAGTLTRFDPGHSDGAGRYGLMAIPAAAAAGDQVVASVTALAGGDPAATAAVVLNVTRAAELLAAHAGDGWPAAVACYVAAAGGSSADGGHLTEAVLGRFALYCIRLVPPGAIANARTFLLGG